MNEQVKNCDLCGGASFAMVREFDDSLNAGNKFAIVKCRKCGILFVSPRPTQDEIGSYYVSEYFFARSSDAYAGWSTKRTKKISRKTVKPGAVLDIGSGKGVFLSEMKQKGWETWGIEPTKEVRDYSCRTFDLPEEKIFCGYLHTANNLPEKYFDMITLWHVMEHVHSPRSVLERINRLAKKGSTLIIEVPNYDSISVKLFGHLTHTIYVPHHLFYFTPATIRRLLESCGWEVTEIDHRFNFFFSLVDFKIGLLRRMGLYTNIASIKSKFSDHGQKAGDSKDHLLWRAARTAFNLACAIPVLFAMLIKKSPVITVWAVKR